MCDIPGCEDDSRRNTADGLRCCWKHYQRFRRNGTFETVGHRRQTDYEYNLWSRVEFPAHDAALHCWLWTGCKTWEGHGQISMCNTTRSVRRIVYGEFVGEVAPNNLVVDTCFDPACVNPFHLMSVTRAEAIRRKVDYAP